MALVQRYDFGKLSKAKPLPAGGAKIPARLTRVGVFVYQDAAGNERRELRLPEEVFSEASLESLQFAPVTNLHPDKPVTSENWKDVSVGIVGPNARQDGRFVAADVVVQEGTTLEQINADQLKELSCGYTCSLEIKTGTFEGERYDCIQRGILYNHVALGPANWGRAGNEVSLRLDSEACLMVRSEKTKHKEIKTMKYRIDGIEYEVGSDAFLQALDRKLASDKEALATETKRADAAEGKAEALETSNKDLQKKLDSQPKDLDTLIDQRAQFRADSKTLLGEDYSFKGKDQRAVMVEAIQKKREGFDPKDRSDDYLQGIFEVLVEAQKKDAEGSDVAALNAAATNPGRPEDNTREDTKVEAWKAPLAFSKDK